MRGLRVEVYKTSLIVKGIGLAFERICTIANCREIKETSNANRNWKEQKQRDLHVVRLFSSPPKVLPGPAARSTFSSEHRSMFCPG
jgi:hypothetical protein